MRNMTPARATTASTTTTTPPLTGRSVTSPSPQRQTAASRCPRPSRSMADPRTNNTEPENYPGMRESKFFAKFLALGLAMSVGVGPRLHAQAEDIPKAQAVVPAPSAAPAATPVKNGVPLRNGDVVEIRIAIVPPEDVGQISGIYTLDESGMINLPLIGLIKAG